MQAQKLCGRDLGFTCLGILLGGSIGCSDPGWVSMASMIGARESHAAVLLPNGDVLLAGGQEKGRDLASAERFIQQNKGWISATPMSQARAYVAAVLLEGQEENPKVLFIGGGGDGGAVGAEAYDPKMDAWTVVKVMDVARVHPSVVSLGDGRALVAGGRGKDGALSSAELYDPGDANTWKTVDPMKDARWNHTATQLGNGEILVAGGENENGAVPGVERFDGNTWLIEGSLHVARYGHSATKLRNGAVLIVGGESNGPLASAELYDPDTRQWRMVGAMSQARHHHTATLLINGKVLIVGGDAGDGALNSAELYDPELESWSAVESLQEARSRHSAVLLAAGGVMLAGGSLMGESLRSVELLEVEGAANIPCEVTSDCSSALVCNREMGVCETLPAELGSTSCALNAPVSSRLVPWLWSVVLIVLSYLRRHRGIQVQHRRRQGL